MRGPYQERDGRQLKRRPDPTMRHHPKRRRSKRATSFLEALAADPVLDRLPAVQSPREAERLRTILDNLPQTPHGVERRENV